MYIDSFSRMHRERSRSNTRYACTTCHTVIKITNIKSKNKKHYCHNTQGQIHFRGNDNIPNVNGDFYVKPSAKESANNKKVSVCAKNNYK